MTIKINIFWDVTPCSLLSRWSEAEGSSLSSVSLYQTMQSHIREDGFLHRHGRESIEVVYHFKVWSTERRSYVKINETKTIRHDLMLNEYPKEFVESVMKPLQEIVPLQTQYTRAVSSSHMLRAFLRNSDASRTVSVSELFSRLNIHSMGH
jgi:hypothetical protein